MGVAGLTWGAAMVESALFRSGGVKLENYAYGPATNPDAAAGFRTYKNQGAGVGHVYIHVSGGGDDTVGRNVGLDKKSRYADRSTTISVVVEILNSPGGQQGLQWLDDNPGGQCWLHGASAITISGVWYGYAPNETVKRKIITAAINMRSHGDALFISSSYPETLQALPVPAVTT
jgi:hypothetical protein